MNKPSCRVTSIIVGWVRSRFPDFSFQAAVCAQGDSCFCFARNTCFLTSDSSLVVRAFSAGGLLLVVRAFFAGGLSLMARAFFRRQLILTINKLLSPQR